MSLPLKKQWVKTQNASFYFRGLECSGCQWVGGGGLGQKVLFRANWNLICCLPGQIQGWETQGELLVLPRLNPGVQGEHLLRQPSWNAASVLVACVCPVYLVDELILISVPLSPTVGLVVAPLTFSNTWWVWFKSYEKSVLFWGMDMEFKDKIIVDCYP